MAHTTNDGKAVEQTVWFEISKDGRYVSCTDMEPRDATHTTYYHYFGPYTITAPVPEEVLAEAAARRAASTIEGEAASVKRVPGKTVKKEARDG